MMTLDQRIEFDIKERLAGGSLSGAELLSPAIKMNSDEATEGFSTLGLPGYYCGNRDAKTVVVNLNPGMDAQLADCLWGCRTVSFNHSSLASFVNDFNDYSKWKNALASAGFDYRPHLNFHVDCSDAETMWNRMSDNRRRQIKRQIKNDGVNECLVKEGVSELDIREWYEILAKLYREKVRTPLLPIEFFLQAYRQGIGHYIMVQYEGKIIGGSMIVMDERCVYEWFECGLNIEYKDQYPSVMATYAGMRYAHENGCRRYDMMGAGVPGVPYGVRDFKAEFGGEMVEHGRFLYIAKPILYALGKKGVMMMKNRL